jgi:hypothetical protein
VPRPRRVSEADREAAWQASYNAAVTGLLSSLDLDDPESLSDEELKKISRVADDVGTLGEEDFLRRVDIPDPDERAKERDREEEDEAEEEDPDAPEEEPDPDADPRGRRTGRRR